MRPYKTGELARLLGISQRQVIRRIEAGDFGVEGQDWTWTKAGPGKGDRRVSVRAVCKYIERNP